MKTPCGASRKTLRVCRASTRALAVMVGAMVVGIGAPTLGMAQAEGADQSQADGGSAGGVTNPLESLRFEPDSDVPCLQAALETGDPDHGPSTYLLKAPSGCWAKWHYHTAAEHVAVIRGELQMDMEGHSSTMLALGGFAAMPGGVAHQFVCKSATLCLLLVSFDAKYDIFWGTKGKRRRP